MMRTVLERHYTGRCVYVFTTEGKVYVGVLSVLDDVAQIVAPDGRTRVHINLSDISGVRLYDEHAEEAP